MSCWQHPHTDLWQLIISHLSTPAPLRAAGGKDHQPLSLSYSVVAGA